MVGACVACAATIAGQYNTPACDQASPCSTRDSPHLLWMGENVQPHGQLCGLQPGSATHNMEGVPLLSRFEIDEVPRSRCVDWDGLLRVS